MPPSTAGRAARIYVAADSSGSPGSYNEIAGIGNVQFKIGGQVIDDSEFGIEWEQNIVGIPNATITLSGGCRDTDTNGQILLINAKINGTLVWYKWAATGDSGLVFEQQASVSEIDVSSQVKDRVTYSASLVGNGAVTPTIPSP